MIDVFQPMTSATFERTEFNMNTNASRLPAGARLRRIAVVFLLAMGCVATSSTLQAATANPPDRLTYQGFLADGNDTPLAPNGPVNYSVVFRVWTDDIGGTLKWAEKQTVTVDKGRFSVILGEGAKNASEPRDPLNTVFTGADASDRYLEMTVTIGTDTLTIAPRLRFVTSPYAMLARSAGSAMSLISREGTSIVTTDDEGSLVVNAPLMRVNAPAFFVSEDIYAKNLYGDIDAGYIKTGVLNRDRIPGLDASKITSGILPIARGGTGSTNVSWVDLSTEQTAIFGNKHFNSSVAIGGSPGSRPKRTLDVKGAVAIGPFATPSNARGMLEVNSAFGYSQPLSGGAVTAGGASTTAASFPLAGEIDLKVSIFASHSIWTEGNLVASSDERIKAIDGRSDSTSDLQTLLGIEITDFHYKDRIGRGDAPHKKVIAQQVEKIYPQAVEQQTNSIPDIYQSAPIQDGWVALETDLKKGERVKLISGESSGIYEVLAVESNRFRTALQIEEDRVFVFGREVKDFRTVEYDALSMLNVSATQELAHRLRRSEARVVELEREMAELRKLVSGLANANMVKGPVGFALSDTVDADIPR